ncbi:MAG: hypothetical protein H7A01_01755 [Hahellaceae bacterium]|nr:hypothetical protein [Hahellaceae bacterium]MCP5212631.1 hypothetical protein [Hahellaceae bacterium]
MITLFENYKLPCIVFCALLTITCVTCAKETDDQEPHPIQNTTDEAEANLKYLLGHALQKSKVLQETHGDFAPYGAALFPDGAVKYVWLAKPGEAINDPALSLPFIRQALNNQALAKQIIGSAVIYKYQKKGQKIPQLTVELEYMTGLSMAFATEMIVDHNNTISWGNNSNGPLVPKVFTLK